MDQVGLPIVLAWQLGRTGKSDWSHVRRAADFIVDKGPVSEQERWENQDGYSPGTIAAEIAGLICAADIARAQRRAPRAPPRYERKADSWAAQRRSAGPRPRNGPYSPRPYYLRVTKDRQPEPGHDVQHRRLRPVEARPAPGRRRQLPRARPARRQALRRPGDPQHAAGRRPAAEGRRVLAPLQLRRLRRAPRRQVLAAVRRRHAHDAGPRVADLRRRARRVRAARRPSGGRPPGGDGAPPATTAGCSPSRSGTAARRPANPASRPARGPSPRPRWRGPTRSSSGSRGRAEAGTPVERPKIVADRYTGAEAKRYPSLPTSRRCGVFLWPGALTNPRLSEHAFHGPRRRPDRCDPRV